MRGNGQASWLGCSSSRLVGAACSKTTTATAAETAGAPGPRERPAGTPRGRSRCRVRRPSSRSRLVGGAVPGAEPGRAGQRRRPGHRRRVRAVLQRRDGHQRRLASDRGRGGRRRARRPAIDYVELEVALDGITVMRNPANSAVTCLNIGDLYALFGPESEGFENWAARTRWPRRSAATTASRTCRSTSPRRARSPARTTRSSSWPGSRTSRGAGSAEDEAETLRPDYQSSADDNVIIEGIEGSERPRVRRVRVRGERGRAGQGDRDRRRRADAWRRPARRSPTAVPAVAVAVHLREHGEARENPALQAFVDYYLSDEGIDERVEQAGYVDLPADRIEATRRRGSGSA